MMLQLCHYDVTKSLLFLIIFFFQSGKASNLACFSACSFIFSSSMARCFALGNKETVNIRINKKRESKMHTTTTTNFHSFLNFYCAQLVSPSHLDSINFCKTYITFYLSASFFINIFLFHSGTLDHLSSCCLS